jgi:hypothetical protein
MKNVQGPLLVQVTLVNATRNAQFNFIPPGREYGKFDDLKSLFKTMRAEWGGRVKGMYRDMPDGETKQVGWVFESRQEYTDSRDTYLREAWVEVVKEVEPARMAVYESVGVK